MASKLKIRVNGLVHNVTASLDTPLLYVLQASAIRAPRSLFATIATRRFALYSPGALRLESVPDSVA